ncbi:MAG: 3-methyl-2-oxobutanoate hydroxymethyltransferase [Coriobacteriia bacterium]|nr:3-methyl-2-oxobutanoate hydroxymethyltransferase [Coriobacteriia bacterium]
MQRFAATTFAQYKAQGKRIVMCTAYDVAQARIVQASGIDAILVGDSLGNTMLGYGTTLPVTMDDMVRATAAVTKGAPDTFIVADLPFMSYQASYTDGMYNAGRLMKEGGAGAVKLEGAFPLALDLVEGLTLAGVPVVGHLGLTPQSVNAFGGFKTQGKDALAAANLIIDAEALAAVGVVALVLECIPAELARAITARIDCATIGIGAGPDCDGEIQVFHDLCGVGGDFTPRHARHFAEGAEVLTAGLSDYVAAVREKTYPAEEQTTHVDSQVVADAQAHVEALLDGSLSPDALV